MNRDLIKDAKGKENVPEILAPVGGKEQLLAAVRCGANAVYFGLSNFNARRNADNFAGEDLKDTISYCHIHDVKVYVTINTLVSDEELKDVKKAVDTAVRNGADGLIIQDLAVAAYAKKTYPMVKRIASTQMVCHNKEGVVLLKEMGFNRVVLARELSLKEIEGIIKETGVEAEVFVHGAHCMSVSGACYMSAMIGGRSGNRGLCAQPCRLDWKLDGKDHVLSLKDLSYISHIKKLADAGVTSLKIEGRMKRAEYVAAAVTACKRAIEGKSYDLETLKAVFSRSGFTDGYLEAKTGPDMFGYRTKEDVVAASPEIFKSLEKLYEKEESYVPIDMELTVKKNQRVKLVVYQDDNEAVCIGDEPQIAKTLPIDEEYAKRSLSKTGGSIYYLRNLKLDAEDGLMVPASVLNGLRREALAIIDKKRGAMPYEI